MIIDNTVEIDSPRFGDAEYQPDGSLVVFYRQRGGYFVIPNVSEKEFLKLQNDPTDEAVMELYMLHRGNVVQRR